MILMGVFESAWTLDCHSENVLCSPSVGYNEVISSLTYNVKFTLNIKSVVLKICYGMTPISVN